MRLAVTDLPQWNFITICATASPNDANGCFWQILLQKWEMRESKRRLGVEARFWLPLAPLGAVASKQLH